MKSKKTKVLVIILCLTMVYMSTVYAATGFSENITQTKSIFSLPSNATKGLFSEFIVEGNTVTNLLDDTVAGCESTSGWSTYQANIATDSSNALEGANCLKITLANTLGSINRDILSLLDTSKYYLITAHIRNGTLNGSGIRLRVNCAGDAGSIEGEYKTDTNFTRVGVLIQPTNFDTAINVYPIIECSGTSSEYGYVDAIMINEISATEYAEGADALLGKYNWHLGTKSTKCNVLQSVGKNLFDKSKVTENSILDMANGLLASGSLAVSDFIRVYKGMQLYRNIRNVNLIDNYVFYDINKNFVKSVANPVSYTHEINSDVNGYIRIQLNNTDLDTYQLEIGTTATAYVKYELSEGFCPVTLRSLGDSQDKFDFRIGKLTKEVEVESVVHVSNYTGYTNLDIHEYTFDTTLMQFGNIRIDGVIYTYKELDADSADDIGTWRTGGSGTKVSIRVAKGAGVVDPVSLTYQLATPETTIYNTAPLACYQNGTVMVLPQVKESAAYNNGMSITNIDLPIKSLVRVDKIENGVLTPVDLSNATIAPDGLSFTIPGAVNGETYIYVYEYAPELSTIPTITYSVPINQDGQITGNTNAIQRHSDLIDIILQQIQLMRQEIQELKTMLQ